MKELVFEDLCEKIKSYKGKKIAITFHSVGDRDSVASAVALAEYLKNSYIIAPNFITRNASQMLKEINYPEKIGNELGDPDVVIVVDANNLDYLEKLGKEIGRFNGELLFIDHHVAPKKQPKNGSIFNDEGYNSTSSIVYAVLSELNSGMSKNVQRALLYGIVSDSAGFRNAFPLTFRQVADLLESTGVRYQDLSNEMNRTAPADVKFLTIKEIKDAKIELIKDYILMYGQTSSHANEAADRCLGLGCDIAVFWAIGKEEASISARMQPDMDKILNMHLGKIMQDAAPLLEGSGGGHPCAASAYGPKVSNAQAAVSQVLSRIRGYIE